jgi:hypothetical protein
MKALKFLSIFLAVIVFESPSNLYASSDSLQALLIVGHQEDLTENAIEDMNKLAILFRENGVKVNKFFDDKADWGEIKKLSGKCSFLVYSGHGSTLGENGGAGGICINSMVTSSELVEEFKLKPNALVCFQSVCMGAGSTAGDMIDIGIDEAKKRVTSYSKPFLEIGASSYFASNYSYGVYSFLQLFFKGETLRMAFEDSFSNWSKIELEEAYAYNNQKHIVLAASPGGGTATYTKWVNGKKTTKQITNPKSYNVAMVGNVKFDFEMMRGK